MSTKEPIIAKNGIAYHVNEKTKKAKKVFSGLKELKTIGKELEKSNKTNFQGFLQFLRDEMSDEPIKVDKNTFSIRGFKFIFHADHIECKDLLHFCMPVKLVQPVTPRSMKEFLMPQRLDRKFSSAEMSAAVERGKQKLLEEKEKIEVASLAKVNQTDELEKARQKALRLIKRYRAKHVDGKRLIEEIPAMVPFKRLNISIGLAIKSYRDKKLKWAGFVDRLEKLLTEETFEKKPEPIVKFIGVDNMDYKVVIETGKKISVDGITVDKGEWLIKFLLQKEKYPHLMSNIIKWLKGEIKYAEVLSKKKPGQPALTTKFEKNVIRDLSDDQIELVEDLFYGLGEFLPHRMIYNKELKLIKDQPVKMYFEQSGIIEVGKIVSVERGIWVELSDGEYPIMQNQKYKLL